MEKIRVAFVKFGGMTTTATDLWMQKMAASLSKDLFLVDYYYCDAAPFTGGTREFADIDESRVAYLRANGVRTVEFTIGSVVCEKNGFSWVNDTLSDVFDENAYDIIQTGRSGLVHHKLRFSKPQVDFLGPGAHICFDDTACMTLHPLEQARSQWFLNGGNLSKSKTVYCPVDEPASSKNLRLRLRLHPKAVVFGLYIHPDSSADMDGALKTYASVQSEHTSLIVIGGGNSIKSLVEKHGVRNAKRIGFTTEPQKVSEFFNTLDVFLHVNDSDDPLHTRIAIAHAHGVACVVDSSEKNFEAAFEVMGSGGIVVDESTAASTLAKLRDDSSLRTLLGKKGRTHVKEYQSTHASATKLANVYYHILDREIKTVLPLEYGYSPYGFLYAGSIDVPATIPYHVMARTSPEKFDVELVSYFLRTCSVFFDIGANTGLYCYVAANTSPAIIHAFEPQPLCCDALRKTVSLNNWDDRFFVHICGLGNAAGSLDLHLDVAGSTGGTFVESFVATKDKKLSTISVPVVTLDEKMKELKLSSVDFLKIDVEGFELFVLQGGEQTISSHKPVIFVEIAHHIHERNYVNERFSATLQWLFDHEYIVLRCTEQNTLELARVDGTYGIGMYLCIHKDRYAKEKTQIHEWAVASKKRAGKHEREHIVHKIGQLLRNRFSRFFRRK